MRPVDAARPPAAGTGPAAAIDRALGRHAWRSLSAVSVALIAVSVLEAGGAAPGPVWASRRDPRVLVLADALEQRPSWRRRTQADVARRLVSAWQSWQADVLWLGLETEWLLGQQ